MADKIITSGKLTVTQRLNIRSSPNREYDPVNTVDPGLQLAYDGYTENGENIDGNARWYFTHEGNWFWSGGVETRPMTLDTSTPLPPRPFDYSSQFSDFGQDGAGVTLCILDSGFCRHPAFAGTVATVTDWTSPNGGAEDALGHGTHVAGIVGARLKHPTSPAVGIAPECTIIIGKVLPDQSGSNDVQFIVDGIDWAIKQQAHILNLSIGVEDADSAVLAPAIKRAYNAGIIIVTAAGSVSELDDQRVQYPASEFDMCISVGAVSQEYLSTSPDINTRISFISGYSLSDSTTCSAHNLYEARKGASMSTAFVSGLIARILSEWRSQGKDLNSNTRVEIVNTLRGMTVSRSNLNFDDFSPFKIAL